MKHFKLLGIISILLCLIACSNTKLAESFDEDTVLEKAKEVVELASAEKYAEIAELVVLPQDTSLDDFTKILEEGWGPILEDKGAFKEYSQHQIAGQHNKEDNSDYAVIALAVSYENGNCIYTLYFNDEYELVGLYLK